MEGEPVRRHVSDAVMKYNKPVFGMFIANRIDTNTAETFRHGVWYLKDNSKQRLNIVPFTLKQFQSIFEAMFKTNQSYPDKLMDLIDYCISKRDKVETPDWNKIIDDTVKYGVYLKNIYSMDELKGGHLVAEGNEYSVNHNRFPYGIYIGSKVKDTARNEIGYVVGISDELELIQVAFENGIEPNIMPVGKELFDKYFVVE